MALKNPARSKRKNPAFGQFPASGDLARMAADLTITHSVSGCTAQEKLLIAALIPDFVKLIRQHIGKSPFTIMASADSITVQKRNCVTKQEE